MNTPQWLLVQHAPTITLATRQWLIPPEQVAALADCTAAASAVAALLSSEHSRIEQAVQQARAEGLAQGRSAGREQALQEAATALAAKLTTWAQQEAQERRQLQEALVPLALLVVRRVAGALAPTETLAALVRQAVQQVMDPLHREGEERCVVRLHPALLAPVLERLGGEASRFSCQADATLAPLDVVIETPSARVLAGLETQLQRVQQALASLPRERLLPATQTAEATA
jgi:type III secretion protein L